MPAQSTSAAVALTPAPAHLEAAAVVQPLAPGDEAAYDAYVLGQKDATLYHLRAWKNVVKAAYGMQAPFLIAREGERGPICGALPLFLVARPFEHYFTSGPFGAYGPVLARDDETRRLLVAEACRRIDAREAKYLWLKLIGDVSWVPLQRKDIQVLALLDLAESDDALFKRIGSSMRAKVRHAQRAGLVPAEGAGELDGFYDVLGENMHRKGQPMYGRPFFQSLLAELPQASTALTLHLEGRAVSGAFLAWFQGVMYVPFVSSRPAVFSLRPNNLLYWEIMRFARRVGCHTLDFGTSLKGHSTLDFKKSWGPTLQPVVSAMYTTDGHFPVIEAENSKLANFAVKAWGFLPRALMDAVGPRICRWVA